MEEKTLKKISFNKKAFFLCIVLILFIVLLQTYIRIINQYRNNRIFGLQAEKYAKEVSNPIFKVSKIIIYSDANVQDLSEAQNLSNIEVSQFTDFVIYIDNQLKSEELSEENTVNRIYIDNIGISIPASENGIQKFSTKKIDDLGKYIAIDKSVKEINYQVIHKNADKAIIDVTNSFYTDCSEPLILSYVNEKMMENKDISASSEKVSLDGSILKYFDVNLEDLDYKINFTIHIENNLGEKFYCNCSLDVHLESGEEQGIYSGYIMQIFDLSQGDFRFKKV